MGEFDEKLKEQYDKLPEDVRRAINETDIRGILAAIVREHGLRIDQAGVLEDETLFVMLGLEHPGDFAKNLEENLSLARDTAVALAQDIDQKLLYSVKQTLMNLHNPALPTSNLPDSQAGLQPARQSGGPPISSVSDIAKIKLEKPVYNGRYASDDPYREPVL